uniref:Retrotransposon protein, putative, unclassified n=1 Tax=Oryza sativa subsp. japonica TaxID=39947 RepID=Q33A52_ORYSJ|nr:retrotransposon protein, putative, unclassified [Oryza sativa Japonica Group]
MRVVHRRSTGPMVQIGPEADRTARRQLGTARLGFKTGRPAMGSGGGERSLATASGGAGGSGDRRGSGGARRRAADSGGAKRRAARQRERGREGVGSSPRGSASVGKEQRRTATASHGRTRAMGGRAPGYLKRGKERGRDNLDLVSDRERQAYYMLSDQKYAHMREYSPELLKKIGMDVEFRSIWKAIGWQRFAVVDEPGSRLLTLQFLCTLKEIEDGISFHFFRKEFTLTWKESIKFSAPVECTSLITRIAKGLGVVSDPIAFISAARPRIDEAYLVQGNILKYGVDESLIYFFPGCTNEIPLPNAGYHLYNCHELIIPLQTIEESLAGGTYRETRNMTRNEQGSSSSSTPVQMYEAGWAPTGDAPGWTQAARHSIRVSTWASASEDRWHAPHDIHWGDNQPSKSSGVPPSPSEWRSSSSRWDLGEITRRMDTLDVQMGEIQYNLTEHIAQTQEWQQSADAQFANINNMMQQQHDDLQAYFRFQGLNPIKDPVQKPSLGGDLAPPPELLCFISLIYGFLARRSSVSWESGVRSSIWFCTALPDHLRLRLHTGPPERSAGWQAIAELGEKYDAVLDHLRGLRSRGQTAVMVFADYFRRRIAPLQERSALRGHTPGTMTRCAPTWASVGIRAIRTSGRCDHDRDSILAVMMAVGAARGRGRRAATGGDHGDGAGSSSAGAGGGQAAGSGNSDGSSRVPGPSHGAGRGPVTDFLSRGVVRSVGQTR